MNTKNVKKHQDTMKLYDGKPKSLCCRADVYINKEEEQDVYICKKCEKLCDVKPFTYEEIGQVELPKLGHKPISRQRVEAIIKANKND